MVSLNKALVLFLGGVALGGTLGSHEYSRPGGGLATSCGGCVDNSEGLSLKFAKNSSGSLAGERRHIAAPANGYRFKWMGRLSEMINVCCGYQSQSIDIYIYYIIFVFNSINIYIYIYIFITLVVRA